MTVREVLGNGVVRLKHEKCSFYFRRLRPGVLLVTIVGYDTGQFGAQPFAELNSELGRGGPVALFMDLKEAFGASTEVREDWTAWFSAHQTDVKAIGILVANRFLHTAVSVAKLFSRTGDLIRIHSDVELFTQAIAREVPGFQKLPSND